jgi:hypothetical protein
VQHAAALSELFVKVGLVAQQAMLLRARVARIR